MHEVSVSSTTRERTANCPTHTSDILLARLGCAQMSEERQYLHFQNIQKNYSLLPK